MKTILATVTLLWFFVAPVDATTLQITGGVLTADETSLLIPWQNVNYSFGGIDWNISGGPGPWSFLRHAAFDGPGGGALLYEPTVTVAGTTIDTACPLVCGTLQFFHEILPQSLLIQIPPAPGLGIFDEYGYRTTETFDTTFTMVGHVERGDFDLVGQGTLAVRHITFPRGEGFEDNRYLQFVYTFTVPEPSTLAMLAGSVVILAWRHRRVGRSR